MTTSRSMSSGFTLVEMLVVLALVVILTVMLNGFGSASHQRTEKERCADNLLKVYLALQIYGKDYDDEFPVVTNARTSDEALNLLFPKYTIDTTIFICPGGRDAQIPDGVAIRGRRISYAYYMGETLELTNQPLMSDRQVNTLPKGIGDPVFSLNGKAPGNNHHKYGGNVLFCDGSVQATPARAAFPLEFTNPVVLLNPKP